MKIILGIVIGIMMTGICGIMWNQMKLIEEEQKKKFYIGLILMGVISILINIWVFRDDYTWIETIRVLAAYFFLMMVSLIDYKKHIIPNKIVGSFLILRVVIGIMEFIWDKENYLSFYLLALFGMAFSFVLLFIVSKLTKGGLGMGDVKMYMVVGAYIGIYGVYNTMFYSILVLLVITGVLFLLKKVDKKSQMPFAPYTYVGYVLILLMGACK